MGNHLVCPQSAIYKVWFEENMVSEHHWTAVGDQVVANQKRANGGCTVGQGGSGSISATGTAGNSGNSVGTNTATTTSTGASSGFKISVTSTSGTITTGPTMTTSSASQTSAFTLLCYPFADPDAGPAGAPQCECDGLDGTYPYLSSTSGQSSYNPCGYTTSPTTAAATSVPGFTTTESDGEVVSCATSTYYNYAVNTIPTCAGSTQVIATVTSIAQAYSASVASSVSAASAASASSASSASAAAWSSAAAVPSAACWILSDDGFGDSAFEVYGINGWAGTDGEKLWQQEDGCGIVSGPEWYTDGVSEFEGQKRDTQYAYFGLGFFKGGCVERAVHSAGGPAPGTGPVEIACQHLPSNPSADQLDAVSRISGPQLKAVETVANGSSTTTTSTLGSDKEEAVVQPGTSSGTNNAALIASASAALPALSAAAASATAS